jgi:hypothetical protein
MKKVLLFSFLFYVTSVMADQVVVDPATYDAGSLPAGITIVDIGGTMYFQVILDGWSSYIEIDDFDVTDNYIQFSAMAKYAVGSGGFDFETINTFLKLANSDFTVEIGKAEGQSTVDFSNYTGAITANDTASRFQFAGQERTGWSAVVGDTLWIGKVTLEEAPPIDAAESLNAENHEISAYPNPVTDGTLNLKISEGITRELQLSIYDTSGKMMYNKTTSEHTITLSTAGFASGVYFIRVSSSDSVLMQKILVK